jgi:hypothetical protein
MKTKIILALIVLLISSCANEVKRQKYLESVYPKSKVEPATGIIQQDGYQFIVIDSTFQIIAVMFYPGSETKISKLRNIR